MAPPPSTPPSPAASADVVICSWQGDEPALTLQVVSACADQIEDGTVVLVDMSPDRARIADPAAAIERVMVVHHPASSGLGESRQLGLDRSGARYVAFLDSDATPRPGWLAALRSAVADAAIAVAGGPVLPVWPVERPPRLMRTASAGDFLSMLDLGPARLDVPRVLPGNMIVDRELVGTAVFDASLGRTPGQGLLGAEEIAMMLRVRREGHRILYEPAAAVDHVTRPERLRWWWFWRRLYAAGREASVHAEQLEPLPRTSSAADKTFQAAVAIPFLAGRLRGR